MATHEQLPVRSRDMEGIRLAEHMSSPVKTVPTSATLLDAARVLAEHGISCLVVMEGDTPAGIISERDLVRLVAADPAGWRQHKMGEVMTHPLHTMDSGASVSEAIDELSRHRIRRLPVLSSETHLAGIVTQTDLLRAAHQRLQNYANDLERLVHQRTAELVELERRRDELVDLTVHDVKNSLATLDAALEMIEEQPNETENLAPLLRRVTARIGNLVRTVLDVNRLESGAMPLRVREVPWTTLCDPLLAEMALAAQSRKLRLQRTGESHVIVRCDPTLLERLLLNLLDNAINNATPGTEIDVHAARLTNGAFLLRVGNRGRPIAPDLLPTLFQKYRQGESTGVANRFGGWGLGLTFCRLAAERHGGTIRAISPYVDGEGAAFEVEIPAGLR